MNKLTAYLCLARPANIVTAFADIFTGFAIAAMPVILMTPTELSHLLAKLGWLLISTAGLYGGGVTFNDVCDADLDYIERPERPIPKGILSKGEATLLALVLLFIGVASAAMVSMLSGLLAFGIVVLSLLYDAYTKPLLLLGPLNMALCRSGNLLLGISIINYAVSIYWLLMFIPLFFIIAVTLISKGEVAGGNKKLLYAALIFYLLTIGQVLLLVLTPNFQLLPALAFLLVFAYLIFSSLLKAIAAPEPANIKKAVKTGIMGLIILDAAIAAGYAGWWYGVLMLLLLPLSMVLAKKFAMT